MFDCVYSPYEPTPWWHPMFWLGYTVRCWTDAGPWDGCYWTYGRPRKVAHELLRSQYGDEK